LSLIIARHEADKLLILSDTKLTYPESENHNLHNTHPAHGTIKTIILNKNIAVSFAGLKDLAEAAIQGIASSNSIPEILESLLAHHNKSLGDVEFLVSTTNPLCIYEIKNRSIDRSSHAWIGSHNAFTRYQGYFLGTIQAKLHGGVKFVVEAVGKDKMPIALSNMLSAFDAVIEDETVPEVNGFKIKVLAENECFTYVGYSASYASKPVELPLPRKPGTYRFDFGHSSASDGGYTVNFFNSRVNFAALGLHIQQGNFGIIYERTNGGLFEASFFKNIDELDFVDFAKLRYNIEPSGTMQNAFQKYTIAGDASFKNGQYEKAIALYQRVVGEPDKKRKANALFAIGICYSKLGHKINMMQTFDLAMSHDPTVYRRIQHYLQSNEIIGP
jgi:hypothetical protein